MGQRIGIFLAGFRQDNHELFAADPEQLITFPQSVAQTQRHFREHLVTGQMAPLIVDGLEVVQIQQNQAGYPFIPLPHLNLAVENIGKL